MTSQPIEVDTSLHLVSPIGVPGVDSDAFSLQPPSFGQAPSFAPMQFGGDTTGSTAPLSQSASGKRESVISYARQFLGTPYVWGGSSPGGFDCSGLVQYAFGKNGISLPRIAAEQARKGSRSSINSLQPGDLIAWDEGGNIGVGHIAIYLGGNQILEAPHTGANVRIRSLGSGGFDSKAFGVHLNY